MAYTFSMTSYCAFANTCERYEDDAGTYLVSRTYADFSEEVIRQPGSSMAGPYFIDKDDAAGTFMHIERSPWWQDRCVLVISSSEFFTSEAGRLALIDLRPRKLKAGQAAWRLGTGFAFVAGNNNLMIYSGGFMRFISCYSAQLLLGAILIVGRLDAAPAFPN